MNRTAAMRKAFAAIYREDRWTHGSGPAALPDATIEYRAFLARLNGSQRGGLGNRSRLRLLTGRAGFATLYLRDALSTLREEIAAAHRRNGLDMSGIAQVEAITLDQLFEAYVQTRTVDFLKLDVEGSEGEILDATSFEGTRPRILVIEATMPDLQEPTWQAWERGLVKKGYLFVWFDGLNRYYVREEDRWRRKCFKVPPNVFDSVRFAPNDPRIKFAEGESVEALRHAVDAARERVSALGAERDALVIKAGTLDGELLSARAESDRLASVTGHLERALSNALDKFLENRKRTGHSDSAKARGGRRAAGGAKREYPAYCRAG